MVNVTNGTVSKAPIEALRRYRGQKPQLIQAPFDGERFNGSHQKRAYTKLVPIRSDEDCSSLLSIEAGSADNASAKSRPARSWSLLVLCRILVILILA